MIQAMLVLLIGLILYLIIRRVCFRKKGRIL